MGKSEVEQSLPSSVASQGSGQNVEARCGCGCAAIRKLIGFKCIFVLLLSAAVFLSAVFWLPPFIRYADQEDLHPDYGGHDIIASFIVKKPVSLLQDNILQLEDDIFEEAPVPSAKVVILSLDPLSGSNMTKVVFAVDPDDKYLEMSSAAVSLTRQIFEDLVSGQSILRLTSSLFGNTSTFQVLRFRGGISVVPPQKAFLLQKVQSLFNFTLNSSIYQIRMNFHELTSQLKSGLHLASYESLYVILSNTEGSTVAPPTIVQAYIVPEIGNNPSKERLKQLAQTIANSHSKNLGLNHTEFGRVKQVRLSSILQHSLHGGENSGTAWSPSPAPVPHPYHYPRHHHWHHHHHHNAHLAPAVSPAYAPPPTTAPANGRAVAPPEVGSPAAAKSVPPPMSSRAESPNCQFGSRKRPTRKAGKHTHLTPAVAPITAPLSSTASPKQQVDPPVYVSHSVPALSPLPSVAFAHSEPPPKNKPAAEHSNNHFYGPPISSSSSSAGHRWTGKWKSLWFVVLVLHL